MPDLKGLRAYQPATTFAAGDTAATRPPAAFGTGLLWAAHTYKPVEGKAGFTNFAAETFAFSFLINVEELAENLCRLTFTHQFIPTGAKGPELIDATKRGFCYPAV
jgi:hypothetical protein